jgi:hypothetical protein
MPVTTRAQTRIDLEPQPRIGKTAELRNLVRGLRLGRITRIPVHIDWSLLIVFAAIGHIEDFLFNPQTWVIRYIAVDTRNVFPGKHVLIAPDWIDRVSWSARRAHVQVTRDAVKESPEYDPSVPLARDYEASLLRHYRP